MGRWWPMANRGGCVGLSSQSHLVVATGQASHVAGTRTNTTSPQFPTRPHVDKHAGHRSQPIDGSDPPATNASKLRADAASHRPPTPSAFSSPPPIIRENTIRHSQIELIGFKSPAISVAGSPPIRGSPEAILRLFEFSAASGRRGLRALSPSGDTGGRLLRARTTEGDGNEIQRLALGRRSLLVFSTSLVDFGPLIIAVEVAARSSFPRGAVNPLLYPVFLIRGFGEIDHRSIRLHRKKYSFVEAQRQRPQTARCCCA
ncbi:hypothetical protein NL676_033432 [Syzygium grande]|nr:hypothetical protein NL676_033432 [Syzygium grande]